MVERRHKHLLNIVCALYFQSKVPLSFWNDYVTITCFLISHTPSQILKQLSLYKKLHNKISTYDSLQVSGCLCFASTLTYSRNKFSPHAIPAIFLGYPTGVKGYKLYDLERCIFVSCDVVLHKSLFPFQAINPATDSLIDPFHDLVIPMPLSSFDIPSPPLPPTTAQPEPLPPLPDVAPAPYMQILLPSQSTFLPLCLSLQPSIIPSNLMHLSHFWFS